MRCWREVALLGARRGIRPIHPNDHSAPRAVTLRILRGVPDGVLTGQLVGNLSVNAGEVRQLLRQEQPSAGLLRELAQDELRFFEALRARLVVPPANPLNPGFRSLC